MENNKAGDRKYLLGKICYMALFRKNIPGREKSRCQDPGAEACPKTVKSKGASVEGTARSGGRGADDFRELSGPIMESLIAHVKTWASTLTKMGSIWTFCAE